MLILPLYTVQYWPRFFPKYIKVNVSAPERVLSWQLTLIGLNEICFVPFSWFIKWLVIYTWVVAIYIRS